jgi:nucleoside-diphosphate-sugar epimerase
MILIVGGSGFIGRHFRDLLNSNGEKNVIITRDVSRAIKHSALGECFVSAGISGGGLPIRFLMFAVVGATGIAIHLSVLKMAAALMHMSYLVSQLTDNSSNDMEFRAR